MSEKRPVGRPKGEASTIVNIRVPLSLLARLDRYVDHQEVTTGRSTNRAIRHEKRPEDVSRQPGILTSSRVGNTCRGVWGAASAPRGPLTARGAP